MADFQILRGDSARISTEATPFADGSVYFTQDDGGLYIDAETDAGAQRIRIGRGRTVPCTLAAAGWTNGQQTISVPGLHAQDNGMIGCVPGQTVEQEAAVLSAGFQMVSQTDGALVIAATGTVPQIDIPALLVILG